MNYVYILTPLAAWIVSQTLKFFLTVYHYNPPIKFANVFRAFMREGGMPSTHTAILTSSLYLVWFNYGFSPLFLFCSVVTGILLYDMALGHKRQEVLNDYFKNDSNLNKSVEDGILLDLSGHTWDEILCGALLGLVVGFIMQYFF